jgi:hypothetical protein
MDTVTLPGNVRDRPSMATVSGQIRPSDFSPKQPSPLIETGFAPTCNRLPDVVAAWASARDPDR